jgi:hypothetical protein
MLHQSNKHNMHMKQGPKTQTTTMMEQHMMENIHGEHMNNNDKNDQPVPPCIMDPGMYDLNWLLEPGEKPEDLAKTPYLS